MRLVNITFKDKAQLESDLRLYQIGLDTKEKYFIQIFGSLGREISEYLIDTLNQLLPGCEILVASSSHQIMDAKVSKDDIVLGISCFLHSTIRTAHFSSDVPEKKMAEELVSSFTSNTKLLIVFIEYFSVSGEEFLNEIYRLAPQIIVSGGKATGSGSRGVRTLVGDTKGIYLNGIVCAVIDSEILNVQNSYSFGWRPIGLALEVTKSHKNVVYEINHTPIKEIYKRYFGDDIFKTVEQDGWNFPFVFENTDGNMVGRVLDKVLDDGGIAFLGNIPEGSRVSFSFGLLENVKRDLFAENEKCPRRTQAIYMYSCIGRVLFLGLDGINDLLDISSDADAVCGFFTYGEVYHFNSENAILNLTNTRVLLSEDKFDFRPRESYLEFNQNKESRILNAMTHLLQVTSKELDATTKSLKSYRDMVDEAIHHNIIDRDLNITYTNEKMRNITGYTKEQIIGKNVLDVLNAEMKDYVLNEVVPTLRKKGVWSGKMSHIKADGSLFYVNTIIKAVFDSNGEVSSYIVGEIDRTDEELNQRQLEKDIKFLQYSDDEKRYLLKQYEELIDRNQSLFRLDLNRNFTYANSTFLSISGFKLADIIGKNIYEFLDDEQKHQFMQIGKALNEKGVYKGIIRHTRYDGTHFYVNSVGVYIKDLDGKPIEIMAVGTDITKIVESQQEIENVQKDVIIAMGTICEGKSRETGNHIKRVAKYSSLLAKLYGCSQEEQSLIEIASPMHDIGKIGIPDAILNKPGKLTPEEFEVMKTHTTLGFEMLKGSNRIILETSAQIAKTHHEWWSGGGYPCNLKGDEIPLFGRITAVADVFDAIGNDRCYKKAWPLPEVIEHIRSLKGKQFQPELVDLFLEHIDEFLVISEKYKD
ncbi:PAS domain S-box protein [Helicobacter cappadocius]|uniref:PAS domain S-box protein n=1 Tax=Helicobacter cappadocius TaxID=3063998 RepID=A0AA90PQK6_9HELI|nr:MULTISPECIES: HD domain-containing phosphohydrolase [unclassified Helicobacter]MDO7253020.1 PAS domain S-box protein [Helicobacter sp. faydin-H75]MDP2538991.1 PAS domain S-box protein [Helicobacter sp. faydin-H76]